VDEARTYTAERTLPLSDAHKDMPVTFVSARCGRTLMARLAAMGIRRGAELVVVRKSGTGPLIIAVGGSRMALGNSVAHQITVAEARG